MERLQAKRKLLFQISENILGKMLIIYSGRNSYTNIFVFLGEKIVKYQNGEFRPFSNLKLGNFAFNKTKFIKAVNFNKIRASENP